MARKPNRTAGRETLKLVATAIAVGVHVGRWWLARKGTVAMAVGFGVLTTTLSLTGGTVARTNVAPVVCPPTEPVLYGFSYTRPTVNSQPLTFVVAGAGELPEGILAAESIVALGDTSPRGITKKAVFVMGLMENRLRGLGADRLLVNAIDVYTVHSLDSILPELVLNRVGPASVHGIRWHYTRPPIIDIEFEMDLRGTRTEVHLA